MSSILRQIDLFSRPAQQGKVHKTTYSGVFSLLTFAIITVATLGKLGSLFGEHNTDSAKEEFMKEKRLLSSKYSNDTNFQWMESSNYPDFDNSILNLSQVGVEKIQIHFAQEGAFAKADKAEKISQATGMKIDIFNKTVLDMKKADFDSSDGVFRHLKYEVKVRSRDQDTNNQTFTFSSSDLKFDEVHNPMLDVTDKIVAKGDFFSLDQNVINKTTTTFRVFADRESVAIESMNAAIEYFEEQKLIAEGKGGSFLEYDCPHFNLGTKELDLSEAEEAALEAEIEQIKKEKTRAFNAKYNSYNLAYLRAKEKFEKELEQWAKDYRWNKHHERIHGDDAIDANQEISKEMVDKFKQYMYKCYDIKYNDAAYTDLGYNQANPTNDWLNKFHMIELETIDAMDSALKSNKFADAIQIKVQTKNQPMRVVSQTSNFLNNWNCFYKANHMSYWSNAGVCEKSRNIVYFQKIENQMQEIFSAPRRPLKVYKSVNLDASLEYKRVITTENLQPYSRVKIDFEPDNDFETVFDATFSIESTKVVDKQIWLIQDQDAFDKSEYMQNINAKFANKNSTRRLLAANGSTTEQQTSAGHNQNVLLCLLEVFSFIGSLWFVLTHLIFGPLSAYMVKDDKPRDIIHVAAGTSSSAQELELQQQSSN